ncbi:MAG: hypothetical protein KDD53_03500, partial [Bdellovibrionales bacterium]|nr:hypothetical protein [Bdellovibrionales bacterium]
LEFRLFRSVVQIISEEQRQALEEAERQRRLAQEEQMRLIHTSVVDDGDEADLSEEIKDPDAEREKLKLKRQARRKRKR